MSVYPPVESLIASSSTPSTLVPPLLSASFRNIIGAGDAATNVPVTSRSLHPHLVSRRAGASNADAPLYTARDCAAMSSAANSLASNRSQPKAHAGYHLAGNQGVNAFDPTVPSKTSWSILPPPQVSRPVVCCLLDALHNRKFSKKGPRSAAKMQQWTPAAEDVCGPALRVSGKTGKPNCSVETQIFHVLKTSTSAVLSPRCDSSNASSNGTELETQSDSDEPDVYNSSPHHQQHFPKKRLAVRHREYHCSAERQEPRNCAAETVEHNASQSQKHYALKVQPYRSSVASTWDLKSPRRNRIHSPAFKTQAQESGVAYQNDTPVAALTPEVPRFNGSYSNVAVERQRAGNSTCYSAHQRGWETESVTNAIRNERDQQHNDAQRLDNIKRTLLYSGKEDGKNLAAARVAALEAAGTVDARPTRPGCHLPISYTRLYDVECGAVSFPKPPLHGCRHPRGELLVWPVQTELVISQNSSQRKVHRGLWYSSAAPTVLFPVAVKFVEDENARDGRSIKREIECHLYIQQRLEQLQKQEGVGRLEDAWPSAELLGYHLDKVHPGRCVLITRKLSGPDLFDVIRQEHHQYSHLGGGAFRVSAPSVGWTTTGQRLVYEYHKLHWCTLALKRVQQYAHLGIRHNDVKPDNIVLDFYITSSGHRALDVKIIDLGTASMHSAKEFTGGTSWYESPEQKMLEYHSKKQRNPEAARRVDIGLASDVWAAGLSVAEVLVGRRVVDVLRFGGPNPLEYRGSEEGWALEPARWVHRVRQSLLFAPLDAQGANAARWPPTAGAPAECSAQAHPPFPLCFEAAQYIFDRLVKPKPSERGSLQDAIDKLAAQARKALEHSRQLADTSRASAQSASCSSLSESPSGILSSGPLRCVDDDGSLRESSCNNATASSSSVHLRDVSFS